MDLVDDFRKPGQRTASDFLNIFILIVVVFSVSLVFSFLLYLGSFLWSYDYAFKSFSTNGYAESQSLLNMITAGAYAAVLAVLFSAILAIKRMFRIKHRSFLIIFLFLAVSYVAVLLGLIIAEISLPYFLHDLINYSLEPLDTLLSAPLLPSIMLAFVCTGAAFARKS